MASGSDSDVTKGDQMHLEQLEAEQIAHENEKKAEHNSTMPSDEAQIKHIFRNAPGHLPETAENNRLIISVANDPNCYIGTDEKNKKWLRRTYLFLCIVRLIVCMTKLNEKILETILVKQIPISLWIATQLIPLFSLVSATTLILSISKMTFLQKRDMY